MEKIINAPYSVIDLATLFPIDKTGKFYFRHSCLLRKTISDNWFLSFKSLRCVVSKYQPVQSSFILLRISNKQTCDENVFRNSFFHSLSMVRVQLMTLTKQKRENRSECSLFVIVSIRSHRCISNKENCSNISPTHFSARFLLMMLLSIWSQRQKWNLHENRITAAMAKNE